MMLKFEPAAVSRCLKRHLRSPQVYYNFQSHSDVRRVHKNKMFNLSTHLFILKMKYRRFHGIGIGFALHREPIRDFH